MLYSNKVGTCYLNLIILQPPSSSSIIWSQNPDSYYISFKEKNILIRLRAYDYQSLK